MGSGTSKKIPRPSTTEGTQDIGEIIFERNKSHSPIKEPYTLNITSCSAKISWIECRPIEDEGVQSPEATVKSGGLNYNKVSISLEPTENGEWGYDLFIKGTKNHETSGSQQVRIE